MSNELTENKHTAVPEGDQLDVEEHIALVEYQQQQKEDKE
tara:strand:- start:25 stop:144 length:120 start_codon:yes stop_codon:yes gene_type:complete